MAKDGIPLRQINLHLSKGVSAVLARRMAEVQTGFCLIQEPSVVAGSIRRLSKSQ